MDRVAKGDFQFWPLLLASKHGHLDVVRALINGGANVDKSGETMVSADNIKVTPLVFAASCGHMDVLKELLRAGATPEVPRDGYNPEERFLLFVRMLLEPTAQGAVKVQVQAASGDGAMLLRIACEKGFGGAVRVLIEKGASLHLKGAGVAGEDALTPLQAACR